MEMGQQELEDLNWKWEQIAPVLQEVPGADVTKLKRYFEEGPAKQGVHFFVVQYRPGTVIMAKGSPTAHPTINLRGWVRFGNAKVKRQVSGPGCWHSPRLRRLQDLVLTASAADTVRPAGRFVRLLAPLFLRFPGVILSLIDTN